MSYDDYPESDPDQNEEMVLKCGYPGCCMPGYHFRHECHNAHDLEQLHKAMDTVVERDRQNLTRPTESKQWTR